MLPRALTLHNYRSFAGPQRLEIRPITLLYGEDNAGKSALLRSLTLLADSAAADGLDALELGRRLEPMELDFDSLRWKGRAETDEHTVGLDLHWHGDPVLEQARFAVWEEPSWRRLVVQQLKLVERGAAVVNFDWQPRREDRRSSALLYRRTSADAGPEPVCFSVGRVVSHGRRAGSASQPQPAALRGKSLRPSTRLSLPDRMQHRGQHSRSWDTLRANSRSHGSPAPKSSSKTTRQMILLKILTP